MSSLGGWLGGGEEGGSDGGLTWLTNLLTAALEQIGFPIGQSLVAILYGLYRRLTWFNSMVFVLKYVPTGLFGYKTIKNGYVSSRDRIKKKQTDLDDIQLQIQIVDTKLCMRDAEFSERTEQFRCNAEQLRKLRARVRGLITADDVLRCVLRHAGEVAPTLETAEQEDPAAFLTHAQEEDQEFILTLVKQLKGSEQSPELDKLEQLDRGGQSAGNDADADNSANSSLNDDCEKQECRVKIIKVTNVYKVACLKHYIKQKRLRRATQQAILKKKIENIKKLLESWQKSLNAVIYSKLSLDAASVDVASQEAMGDYTKPNLREFSDSDSELKTSCTDICYDEYNLNWTQNSYYNVQNSEPVESKEMFEPSDYHHKQEMSYSHQHSMLHAPMCECTAGSPSVLCILPEETSSQVAIEEIEDDTRVATTNC